jgi:Uncharacterised nucleotidyltransferase
VRESNGRELFAEAGTSATDARAVWATQVTAKRALDVVAKGFERAGIDVLAVKGIVTSRFLYREPTERPMGDVDVRIRAEDFRKARRVAEAEGWSVWQWKPSYGAFVLVVEDLGVSVDVESVIGAPGLCGLSIAEMLGRATRGAFGLDVRVPELHDHAVLLSVNVFKDKLAGAALWALEDVKRIVEVDDFDADRFVDLARRAKVASIVWIVADWMVRERGSETWREIRARLGGERAPRPVYAWAFRRLGERAPTAMATRVLARVGADDPRMWVRAMVRAVMLEWGDLGR